LAQVLNWKWPFTPFASSPDLTTNVQCGLEESHSLSKLTPLLTEAQNISEAHFRTFNFFSQLQKGLIDAFFYKLI